MLPGYEPLRAAQVAAFFAIKEGGSINVLKLTKLLYLAERRHIELYDEPMFFDRYVSMNKGPVPSATYDLISGSERNADWDCFISDKADHKVGLRSLNITIESLDQLSKSDLRILQSLWDDLGDKDQWELVEFTHDNCPEWDDPKGSAFPIKLEHLLKFLGKDDVEGIAADIHSWRNASRIMKSPA